MLSYAEYLHGIYTQDRLDHSAVYTASRWIEDCLQESRGGFSDIQVHAKTLFDAVTLTSGRGLFEIWSSLSMSLAASAPPSKISSLDAIARVLPRGLTGRQWSIGAHGLN